MLHAAPPRQPPRRVAITARVSTTLVWLTPASRHCRRDRRLPKSTRRTSAAEGHVTPVCVGDPRRSSHPPCRTSAPGQRRQSGGRAPIRSGTPRCSRGEGGAWLLGVATGVGEPTGALRDSPSRVLTERATPAVARYTELETIHLRRRTPMCPSVGPAAGRVEGPARSSRPDRSLTPRRISRNDGLPKRRTRPCRVTSAAWTVILVVAGPGAVGRSEPIPSRRPKSGSSAQRMTAGHDSDPSSTRRHARPRGLLQGHRAPSVGRGPLQGRSSAQEVPARP